MRCMCKSWNALLSEPSFVKSHRHRSIHNNEDILLFFRWGSSLDRELTDFIKLPVNLQSESTYGSIIGSVNGLICFYYKSYNHDADVYIWNPSLSVMLTLPPCSLPSNNKLESHFRFGFDPKTDDYKVVKVTSLFKPPNILPEVEVYSMRKGSWELISQSFPSNITYVKDLQHEVCTDGHDGHLHWLCGTDFEWKPLTIVAYDLGPETFREIPLPDSIIHRHGHGYCINVLGVSGGKLCLMSKLYGGKCEMWVMDENGVAESWVRYHAFPQFSGDIVPYGFTLHNEFLFQGDGSFGLHDPVASKTKTFKMNSVFGLNKIVEYVDSLVWVAPAKCERSCSISQFHC